MPAAQYGPTMRSGPLRHRWFALFTGTVTSGSIGDEVMRLALPLLVLDLTHDIGAAATLRVIETVPYVTRKGMETIIVELLPTEPKAKTVKPDDFLDTRFVSQLEREGFYRASASR